MRRTVHETSGPTVLLFVHLSRPTRVWSHFSSRPSRDVERSVVGERASDGSRRSVSCLREGRDGSFDSGRNGEPAKYAYGDVHD